MALNKSQQVVMEVVNRDGVLTESVLRPQYAKWIPSLVEAGVLCGPFDVVNPTNNHPVKIYGTTERAARETWDRRFRRFQ